MEIINLRGENEIKKTKQILMESSSFHKNKYIII